jgi:hypothetical protein
MKVALRKRNGILEFLGFVDGKGRIRKARISNPGKYVVYTDGGYGPPKSFNSLSSAKKFASKIGVSFVNVISTTPTGGKHTDKVYQKIGSTWTK